MCGRIVRGSAGVNAFGGQYWYRAKTGAKGVLIVKREVAEELTVESQRQRRTSTTDAQSVATATTTTAPGTCLRPGKLGRSVQRPYRPTQNFRVAAARGWRLELWQRARPQTILG